MNSQALPACKGRRRKRVRIARLCTSRSPSAERPMSAIRTSGTWYVTKAITRYCWSQNGYGYWSVGESGSRGGVGESSGRRGRYRDEIATGETCGDGSSGADINSSEPRIPRMGRPARPKVRVNKLLRQRSARTHPSEPMPLGGPSRKRMLEEPLAWQGARQRQRRGTPDRGSVSPTLRHPRQPEAVCHRSSSRRSWRRRSSSSSSSWQQRKSMSLPFFSPAARCAPAAQRAPSTEP